ncbi:F-box domain [Arabidopsis suecica]|uniref:F-box domain n=1 Tax=Arabidopsis suecica TaxID=45249 RepID=A0A8T2ANG2_ARASU|nr:F-box domain [Arabidopsis suecica]
MEDDRISQLPDQLISQILSHLPIKESVKSSVLSTRWRSLWLWVTDLELISKDYPDFDAFVGFGESFFDSNRVSSLHKLKLAIDEVYYEVDDVSYLTSWIDAAIKRKIQHLSFHWCVHRPFHMMNHLRLYNCETLVYLDLLGVSIDNAEFVSFPCLKTMHLDDILYPNEATLEKLVSCCCPVLEELKIFISDGGDLKGFQVHSLSLKRFTLIRTCAFNFDSVPGVVIDAPLLCCLRIYDEKSESFIVNNMKSNAQLVVSLVFGLGDFNESKRSSIRSFLGGISRVGDMTIHADTFKRFCQYSKVEPLPQFGYMSDLAAEICEPDLKCLPTFLESCPNLKSLTLVMIYSTQ